MKIGSAKYGGEFKKKTYAKLKDGEQMFRILPPLGDLADKGVWSVFWNVHYGYTNSAGKLRTFASPLVENRKTKMIEVPDAALERIQKLKGQLEAAKIAGNAELASKLTALVGGAKPKFNMDKNHYMNAVDASGQIVILQLRHKAKKALDIEIGLLRDKGIDPLAPSTGRFFVFRRTGMGLDTTFKVSVAQKTIEIPNVGPVQQDIVHVLDATLISRLAGEAADLDRLYKTPTSAEVARIVAEGPIAVDAILDAKGGAVEEMDEETLTEAVATLSPETKAHLEAALASVAPAAQPTQTAVQPAYVAPTPAAKPATPAVASMTDEEFLKSMGL